MKKFVSILLALTMALAMSVTAFAEGTTNLTINSTDSTIRTYNGYKLLDLTTSLKCPNESHSHDDNCYNYAYTVNGTYRAILQTVTEKTSDADIIAYLGVLRSDNDGGTLRPVADRIYRAIKNDASIVADAPNLSNTGIIDQGYWLFADVTTNLPEDEAHSLVIVDTKGQNNLTITPKTGLPTIEKKVKDINDSTDTEIDDNAWQDSADHDINNDPIPFKLTATLPANLASYNEYMLSFHDTLSDGLTLKDNTIKVLMYANKATAEADTDTNTITENDGATDVTNFFSKVFSTNDCDCTFEISCENVLDITDTDKDTVFVVYYEATLNGNAEIGATGNPNEVYLEFSNDPYGDGTGKTETDKVIVFTYQVTINKTDANDTPLSGAVFTLYKQTGTTDDGKAVWTKIEDKLTTTNDNTTFDWTGLDDGNYKLEETTPPAGYNKIADIEFTITAVHAETSANPTLTSLDGGNLATGIVNTGVISKNIENHTGTVLPETGAKGTFMLIACSSMFVMVAAVFMVTRKKMSIYED